MDTIEKLKNKIVLVNNQIKDHKQALQDARDKLKRLLEQNLEKSRQPQSIPNSRRAVELSEKRIVELTALKKDLSERLEVQKRLVYRDRMRTEARNIGESLEAYQGLLTALEKAGQAHTDALSRVTRYVSSLTRAADFAESLDKEVLPLKDSGLDLGSHLPALAQAGSRAFEFQIDQNEIEIIRATMQSNFNRLQSISMGRRGYSVVKPRLQRQHTDPIKAEQMDSVRYNQMQTAKYKSR